MIRRPPRSTRTDTLLPDTTLFRSLSFMGILGLGGTSPDDLFDVSNPSILAIPQLQWNFLDFGRVDASVDQASAVRAEARSEEHTSELQSLMRISYAVFCLKKKTTKPKYEQHNTYRQLDIVYS